MIKNKPTSVITILNVQKLKFKSKFSDQQLAGNKDFFNKQEFVCFYFTDTDSNNNTNYY